MESNAAAIWSAVAASFAALSSILIMLIQRRNLLESVRPELILTNWDRRPQGEGSVAPELITFNTIKNIGRGPALHILVNSKHLHANRLTAVLSTIRLPILAPNEAQEINGEITVWWQNISPDTPLHKRIEIDVAIGYWDSRSIRHETKYSLFVVDLESNVGVFDAVAPGVMLERYTTISRPGWLLRLFAKARRFTRSLQLHRKDG